MAKRAAVGCVVLFLLCGATLSFADGDWREEAEYMRHHTIKMAGGGWLDLGNFDDQFGPLIGLRVRDKWQAKFGYAPLEASLRNRWSSYRVDDDYWYVLGSRIWRFHKHRDNEIIPRRWYVGAGIGWHFADAELNAAIPDCRSCSKYSLAGHILVGYDMGDQWTAELYWVFGSELWDWDVDGIRVFITKRFH